MYKRQVQGTTIPVQGRLQHLSRDFNKFKNYNTFKSTFEFEDTTPFISLSLIIVTYSLRSFNIGLRQSKGVDKLLLHVFVFLVYVFRLLKS